MNSYYVVNNMKTSHAFQRWIVSILAILAAVLSLCGCLSKPPLHKQTFTFGAPPTASGRSTAGVLTIWAATAGQSVQAQDSVSAAIAGRTNPSDRCFRIRFLPPFNSFFIEH